LGIAPEKPQWFKDEFLGVTNASACAMMKHRRASALIVEGEHCAE
jgi:hypothetical protein